MTTTDETKPLNKECHKLPHKENPSSYSAIICPDAESFYQAMQSMNTEKQGGIVMYTIKNDISGRYCGVLVSGELKDASAEDLQ